MAGRARGRSVLSERTRSITRLKAGSEGQGKYIYNLLWPVLAYMLTPLAPLQSVDT